MNPEDSTQAPHEGAPTIRPPKTHRVRPLSRRLATAALTSAVALAGCSNNSSKPTVLPTLPPSTGASTTSTAATTPAPTKTAAFVTAEPAPATVTPTHSATSAQKPTTQPLARTAEAIEKAARAYFVTTNRALHDGAALAKFRASFAPTCQQCATDLMNIAKIHAANRRVTGGGYNILNVVAQATDSDTGAVTVTFSTLADVIYYPNGKVAERDTAQPKQRAGITLNQHNGRWLIVGWIDFGKTT